MNKDYNTQREPLVHKEYGRNIKNLATFVKNIEDKEERTKYAYTLVKLMKQIIPNPDLSENDQKYWDDIQIISDFSMDVDAPFPIPEKETLTRKPDKVPYHSNEVQLRHYGRNVELLIEKAIDIEDPKEKEVALIYIGRLMKTFHSTWSKENVEDGVIIKNMEKLSKGKLTLDVQMVTENGLFESLYKNKSKPRHSGGKRSSGGYGQKSQNRNNKGRNQNRRRKN